LIVHSALTQAVATLLSALLVQMQDRSVGSHFDWTMAVSKQLNWLGQFVAQVVV
jgi:hypothetical protein